MKTIKERLKAKGITEKSKFHNYDYLYKSIVEVMKEYENEVLEVTEALDAHKQINDIIDERNA